MVLRKKVATVTKPGTDYLRRVTGYGVSVLSMLETPDSLWTGSGDFAVRIFEKNTMTLQNEFATHTGAVRCMAMKDNQVITGSLDKEIHFLDQENPSVPKQVVKLHTGAVNDLIVVGEHLWSASADGTIQVIDMATRQAVCTLNCQSGVNCLCEVGGQVWAGLSNDVIRTFDAKTLKHIRNCYGHNDTVRCVNLVQHNTVWSTSESDPIIRIWDARHSRFRREVLTGGEEGHTSIAAVGNSVWVGSVLGGIRVFDATTMNLTRTLEGHRKWVARLIPGSVNVDGAASQRVWSASWDQSVLEWDAATFAAPSFDEAEVMTHEQLVASQYVEEAYEGAAEVRELVMQLKTSSSSATEKESGSPGGGDSPGPTPQTPPSLNTIHKADALIPLVNKMVEVIQSEAEKRRASDDIIRAMQARLTTLEKMHVSHVKQEKELTGKEAKLESQLTQKDLKEKEKEKEREKSSSSLDEVKVQVEQ
jgi:hypothetical protein